MVNNNQSSYQLTYEIAPIILANGIATGQPQNQMAIIQITDSDLLDSGDFDYDYRQFFAHYRPMQNGTLVDNDFGRYPFANMTVAANAIITQPLKISMLMTCTAQTDGGYLSKLSTWTNLIQQLNLHNQSGGYYIICTPSYIYTGCLLRAIHDISRMDTNQPQNTYQWDFEQPLLTQDQAQVAYNSLMMKVAAGLPNTGAWSGQNSTLLTPTTVSGPTGTAGVTAIASAAPPFQFNVPQ